MHLKRSEKNEERDVMIAKIYKCFIASPRDTQAEREACEVAFTEINSTLGDQLGFRIESVRWENHASPGFGKDGQDVLNRQLSPGEHDFFIGIMWCRFGTPTPRAESGTEEEFNQAYDSWKKCNNKRLQIYFNTAAPKNLNDIDTQQLDKVRGFKQKVSGCGGFYVEYDNLETFKTKFRASIEKELLAMSKTVVSAKSPAHISNLEDILNERLNQSLSMFSHQQVEWIDRILCKNGHITSSFDIPKEQVVHADKIIADKDSCVIKAPPQFGLTCLAHYMIREAWLKTSQVWAYIDFESVSSKDVSATVAHEGKVFGLDRVDCILLDSWSSEKNGAQKILEVLHNGYPSTRLVVMQTANEELNALTAVRIRIERNFTVYNLLALPRGGVRKAVKTYGAKIVDDENTILNKLILDFEALNIHRTPMNCWTLLKAAESRTERDIINRTQMLEKVLFVLFNLNMVSSYGSLPDAKDCEHVLGFFCEGLVRKSQLVFTKDKFIVEIKTYCSDKLVDINVDMLYNVLIDNRILVLVSQGEVRFRASFWVYYFAAKRMHNNEAFRSYILSERRYAQYSEVIEFYTGIDRNRDDILRIMCDELRQTRSVVDEKLGFAGVLNPLKLLRWTPNEADVENMKKRLSDEVLSSNIPEALKDQHVDKSYNQLKPYNQNIKDFLQESSFLQYRHQLDAASKALRNSDYADVEVRKELLKEIVGGWTEIAKVLFVLAPVLTTRREAAFDGFGFYLSDDFRSDAEGSKQLFINILNSTPFNVVSYVKDHLASDRVGSLFYDFLKSGPNALARHLVILFLVNVRPRDWSNVVEKYIGEQDKNSFYLVDLFNQFRSVYKFEYLNYEDDKRICYLMKKCLAKHRLAINNPVGKIVDKISDASLPKKEYVDVDE